jgi:hypothetical protein
MPEPTQRHVAVVVVHGVGYHAPGQSANEVAHLLLRLTPEDTDAHRPVEGARYPAFREEPLAYALHPLETVPDQCPGEKGPPPPDRTFMRELLEHYEPDPNDRVAESVRLGADRRQKDAPPAGVDVYEVYWSDIAGLGSSVLSIFGTFYNILIHAPLLGVQTLDLARQRDGAALPRWGWALWSGLYRLAFGFFGIVVPVLTLLMVPLALAIVPVTQRDDLRQVVAAVLPVIATIGITFWIQYRRQARLTMGNALLSAAAGAIVALLVTWQWRRLLSPEVVLAEWWILSAVLVAPVLAALRRERRFIIPLGVAVYLAFSAMLMGFGLRHDAEANAFLALRAERMAAGDSVPVPFNSIMRIQAPSQVDMLDDTHGRRDDLLHHELGRRTALFSILNTFEWGYVALSVAWVLFALAFTGAVIAGWLVRRMGGRDPARHEAVDRLQRTSFTMRLSMAVPAVLFVFASFFAWGVYYNLVAWRVLPEAYAYVPEFQFPAGEISRAQYPDEGPCPVRLVPEDLLRRFPAYCSAKYFPDALEGAGATQLGIVSAVLVLVAFGLVGWAAFPSGLTEYASPQAVLPTAGPLPPANPLSRAATALGTWLSTGFGLGRRYLDLHVVSIATGGLATAVMLPLDLAPLVAFREALRSAPAWLEPITLTRLLVTSGSAIGLIAVAERFSAIGRGLRPFLTMAVDIANYLRQFPRTRTPRARIMERYASLLRFVCRWRPHAEPGSPGYDAVVVVAHSQGTIISADILRYLAHVRRCGGEPALARLGATAPVDGEAPLPLYLFTMGSPLRQLYAQRFPHLYAWSAAPDPDGLYGVRNWVNVFRSGDYVGRSLWFHEEPSVYVPGAVLVNEDDRREYSLGTGAHTHYWDGTATAVGVELDRLIRRAVT